MVKIAEVTKNAIFRRGGVLRFEVGGAAMPQGNFRFSTSRI